MGIALDAFGWTADQWWLSTPAEFYSMIDARQRANKAIGAAAGR